MKTWFRVILCLLLPMMAAAQQVPPQMQRKIAQKIWQNECNGTVKGLVAWNQGEEFPSLGIGHFIWYPKGVKGRYEESFPSFVRYAESRGIRVPREAKGAAPWPDRQSFQRSDSPGGIAEKLRNWLAGHTELQAAFIMERSAQALQRMERASRQPKSVRARYQAIASTPQGMYALIDYVNFKGEGTNPAERYKGQGWGLLQVLEEMKEVAPGPGAAAEFARASKRVLQRRVDNSPPGRGEKRWLKGWFNRCDTYAKPL